MSSEYTNQHYVPRCYLRGFSFGKKENPMVYVYDKKISKPYVTPIKKICYEEDLYTIKDTQLSEKERKRHYEVNYLKKEVEDYYGPCLEDTVSKLSENNTLTVQEKIELAHFIAIQFLRQPNVKTISQYFNAGVFSDFSVARHVIEHMVHLRILLISYSQQSILYILFPVT